MQMLAQIVDYIVKASGVDWFGIYQKRDINNEEGLVKLSYHGAPSRPIFPLTSDFSLLSNNVQVALSKTPRIINDIESYQAQGGEWHYQKHRELLMILKAIKHKAANIIFATQK